MTARSLLFLACWLASPGGALAFEGGPAPSGQGPAVPSAQGGAPLPVPHGLPRYDIDMRLDPARRVVSARERVVFTNRSTVPIDELVFHVYPRYRVPDADKAILAKTLEYLRLSPEEAADYDGRRMQVGRCRVAGRDIEPRFDPSDDTILIVPLAASVPPGGTVAAEIDFLVDLPDKWGRWGQHNGITYLANWHPVLAHHDARGWERTPFVPWHQPWHQEAGHYTVRVDLPDGQVIASSGHVVEERSIAPGWKRATILASPSRDFALVCSERFEVRERFVSGTRVRVHGLPEHGSNPDKALDYACEVIAQYERWFGPYYDREFEIAPSYFGWNGNECSGLVLLDDRIMKLPSAGERYLDHLVTHETCHQWWWNVVGTDGYAETFMDEGLVNCFTALRLDAKYGRNAPLITWPRGLTWLPTVGREDLRLAGYYGWRAKGGDGPVMRDLGEMGNLQTLFSLAYDRGGKVVLMIHNRLGEKRFFEFLRSIYVGYAYQTFHYEDLRRELAAFDPAGDWPAFLDGWLLEHNETDWAIDRVDVGPPGSFDPAVRPVTIELRQDGQMHEPTVLLCRCDGAEVRIPIWPDRGSYDVPGARVDREGPDRWRVRFDSPGRPSQIEVDPDHALLDAVPHNNRWRPDVSWRVTPVVTPLDQSPMFAAYDRPTIIAGPFIDQYARGGFKVGALDAHRWEITAWAGAEPALSEAIFGGEAALHNWPGPNWSPGVFYEEGLYNFYNDQRHSGGRLFLRRRLFESSSVLVDDPVFFEFYYGYGNEFWAGDTGRPVNGMLAALGTRFRYSTLTPYWDPVQGELLDVAAEYGDQAYGSARDYVRVVGEWGIVRKLPTDWGLFPRSRFALRGYGGWAWPDHDTYFRLGGGNRLRALDLVTEEGSALWLMTFEWRFPLWREVDRDFLDHILSVRNLYGAAFYDVGQSYLDDRWGPVVHGPGFGLRLDVSLFTFIERAVLRFDIAQPIGLGGEYGPVLWFGLNQIF